MILRLNSTMKPVVVVLTLSICFTAYLGDFIVFKSKFSNSQVFRAFSDSAVHASIGFLSSLLFFSNEIRISNHALVFNVIFCTILSSLIDIDHVIVARSFRWKDFTNLKQRGIFHCTSFWLVISAVLFAYSHLLKKSNIYVATWMLTLAYSSHHIRDANRRGLWLYPFGHTPALNKHLYIISSALFPNLFAFVCRNTIMNMFRHTTIDYKNIV